MITTDPKLLALEITDAKERIADHIAQRVMMIKTFAGPHYRGGTDTPIPDNYPFAYKTFIKPQLLYGRPNCTVTPTLEVSDAPIAEAVEAAVNAWGKTEGPKDVLDEAVDDTFFGFGMTKVCMADGAGGFDPNYPSRTNGIVLELVPPECIIIDARAKRRRDVRLIGHEYERDLEDVKLDMRYDADVTASLTETATSDSAKKGDTAPREFSAERKRLTMVELYLPERNLILTLAMKGETEWVVLRQATYKGPKSTLGPYDLWGLESVAGELFPISPIQALWDEFLEVNDHSRAAADSASTHKKLGLFANANKQDATNIQKAKNGDMVGVQDPASVKDFEIGGASETQVAWIQFLREKFDRNLGLGDAQRGVAADRTATGEQIAAANSDLRVDTMRDRIATCIKRVFTKVAWYFYHDDTIAPLQLTVPNHATGMPEEATFISGPWDGGFVDNQWIDPQDEPPFEQLQFDVDVRSMTKSDDALEQKRAQDEIALCMQFHQMGFPINWRRVIDRYGSAFNVRDYSKIILLDQMGMMIPPDPLAAPPGMAQQMLASTIKPAGGAGGGGKAAPQLGQSPSAGLALPNVFSSATSRA
jgi:hypothetical protein